MPPHLSAGTFLCGGRAWMAQFHTALAPWWQRSSKGPEPQAAGRSWMAGQTQSQAPMDRGLAEPCLSSSRLQMDALCNHLLVDRTKTPLTTPQVLWKQGAYPEFHNALAPCWQRTSEGPGPWTGRQPCGCLLVDCYNFSKQQRIMESLERSF